MHCVLTHKEAEEIFTLPKLNLASYYSFILNTLFTCVFYAKLIPLAPIFGSIGISLIYWA